MAETTLFPVASLPTCVSNCGVLFDVNGACVPPAVPTADATTYDQCFCGDSRLAAFNNGASGVCDSACAANPDDLTSIQSWYTSFCSSVSGAEPTETSTSTTTPRPVDNGGGGNWLDNHYQWVIFAVIMVVAIVGIWVGACVWRRRYIRKKDRMYALGTNLAHATESGRVVPNDASAGSVHAPAAGMFDPAPISSAAVYPDGEKLQKSKKKWTLKGRT